VRTTLRVQMVGSTVIILLAALGAYVALATSLVTQDKIAYVYQVTSFLARTKSEEVRSSLSSQVDKLRFIMAYSADNDDLDAHLRRVVDADEEILALELWKRGANGDYALLSRLVREDRLRGFGADAGDLAASRQADPIPFEALRRTDVVLRNASLPPDLPILTIATALGDVVAVADLQPQHLLRLFAGLDLGHAYLVDSRGSILLHSEPEVVIARRRATSSELITEAFSAKVETGVRELSTPDGTTLGAYASLDYGDVAVVIETPKDMALRAAERLNRQAIMLAIVVVLLAVMVGIVSSRRIVAPLRRLEAITATIAQGDFSVEVPETGPNETRTMAASLNRMRHDLADREQRLTTMVGSLAGGVAHEANNPLASVIANIDFALASARTNATADAEIIAALEDARAGGLRVRDIIRDLHEFGSSETSAPARLDVQTALDSALKMATPQLKYRGEVEKVYHPVPQVFAPERELAHAFLNLVVNAARALPEHTPKQNRIRLATRTAEDGAAIIEVTDTGDGIPADEIGRVFDPYYAGHLPGVGSSLGLATTRTVVNKIGGSIRVTSEVGHGTTFTVTLPAAPAGAAAPTPTPESAISGARRILVIDDDPLVRTTLERLLGQNAEVIAVRSGTAALRTLEADAGFDAVLCDIMMPDISGIDVFEETRKRDPELARRFVFMTGGAYTERVQKFRAAVDNPVLDKPFDHETLVALLDHSAGGKRG